MVKILNYDTLQKKYEKCVQSNYEKYKEIKRLKYKINNLENELKNTKKKIKEQELIIGWLKDTEKPLETWRRL